MDAVEFKFERMDDLRTAIEGYGFTRLQADSEAESTVEVAQRIGTISKIPGLQPTQRLVPRAAAEVPSGSYSSLYGLGSFPLHTDMAHWNVAPRYLLLRCLRPAPAVATLVVRCQDVIFDEPDIDVRRALFRPRRRLEGRLSSLRLQEGGRYRWDPVFIQPLNARAEELRSRVLERLEKAKPHQLILEKKTDCILIDNWNALHGRMSVSLGSGGREVERIYLDSLHL